MLRLRLWRCCVLSCGAVPSALPRRVGWRSPLVVASGLGSAGALAAVMQTPGVSQFFGCRPVGAVGWGIGLTTATAATAAVPLAFRLVTAVMGARGTRLGRARGLR
jgi:hypothetical protein